MPEYEHDRERRLATSMAADIVGYSRLMDNDEEGTYTALLSARSELIEPGIEEHKGRIVKHTGDGFLAEFPTVMSAIHFAMSLQEEMGRRMAEVPAERQIKFRIGVNLGDIIIDETGDIFGDGVNVAARLEPIAIPGGICISGAVYDSVHKKLDAEFNDLGPQEVKNISTPVRAYDIRWPGEAGKPEERAVKPQKQKPKALVIGAAAVVVIGIVLWFMNPIGESDTEIPENSVAVLPFVNRSPDPEQEYFSDGISEELLNILSRVGGLRVPARTSTFKFKGQNLDVGEIALQLNVAHVLEGSVRKAGNRVRINAQLIDADTGYQLWSDNYDRELDDIFAVQDEISRSIVDALREVLNLEADAPVPQAFAASSTEAYDQYLLGQHFLRDRRVASIETAIDHFSTAIAADENFAPAYAAQSIAWMLLVSGYGSYGNLSLEEATDKALPLAEKALELDPESAEAHAARAQIYRAHQDFVHALRSYDKAIELNPNFAYAFSMRGWVQRELGQFEESLESNRHAAELDPLSLVPVGNYVHELFLRARYEEMEPYMQRVRDHGEHFYSYSRYWHLWHKGQYADAIVQILDGRDSGQSYRPLQTGLIYMFGLVGLDEESERILSPADQQIPWQWQENWELLTRLAQEDYLAHPEDLRKISALGKALLASGDIESAATYLERYVNVFDDGTGPSPEIAGYVALIRRESGQQDGATAILNELKKREDLALSAGLNNSDQQLLSAMIALMEDDQDRALDSLERIARGPGIHPQVTASLRYLTSLSGNSRFKGLLEDQAAHRSSERRKLLGRICGDQQWQEWKPLPSTCER